MPVWRKGIRGRLKSDCRKTCGFDSRHRYMDIEMNSVWHFTTPNGWEGNTVQVVHEHFVIVDFIEYVVIRDWDTARSAAVGAPHLFRHKELVTFWERM